jgi:hypothetical protein
MESDMWTEEDMDMYSARLTKTEEMVMKALSLGYQLDDALDYISVTKVDVDIDYAKAYIESMKYPDRRVPLV